LQLGKENQTGKSGRLQQQRRSAKGWQKTLQTLQTVANPVIHY
jgi:hypothetical protein